MSGTDEDDRIYIWRRDEGTRLGLGWDDACQLGASECELEWFRKLVEGGCDPRVALEIVL